MLFFHKWVRALRVHHWSKNLLLLVPLVTGHNYTDVSKVTSAAVAFVFFCMLTSAVYLINDVVDADSDRKHPKKNKRPIARKEISVRQGAAVALVLVAVSLGLAFVRDRFLAAAMSSYFLIAILYSFRFRSAPFLDVFIIAVLFTVRLVAGTLVVENHQSEWLLSFSLSFFLSLSLAKRHGEIMQSLDARKKAVRGYRTADWPLTLAFGVSAASVSIAIMLLYLANDAMPNGFYPHADWLYGIPIILLLWQMRIWFCAHRAILDSDPVEFALRDSASWVLGFLAVIFFLAASV